MAILVTGGTGYIGSHTAIELLKNAGFKMAFAGGSRKAKVNDNLFIIPRYELLNTITMDRFKKIVNWWINCNDDYIFIFIFC